MSRTSSRPFLGTLPALLVLGAGSLAAGAPRLPRTELAAVKAQQPARVLQAQQQLAGLKSHLGLDAHADFIPHHPFTNDQGRTVVRFHQTHDGFRVWGSEAVVHVEADGTVKPLAGGLKADLALPATPLRLDAEAAKAIALRNLAPKAGPQAARAKVEQVAFPTRFTGGLSSRYDAKRGVSVVDPETSVWAKAPAEATVWAYEVRTFVSNKLDGHKEMNYIIDANSGAILRKWSALQPHRAALVDDTPVQGTGQSYYRGTVPLSTLQSGVDGTYSLVAKDRGTLPQPYFADAGVTQVGLATCYGLVDMNLGMTGFDVYTGNTTNTWGDGTLIPLALDPNSGALLDFNGDGSIGWLQGARTTTGETTAVDAHYGLSTTWDFYKNVFGRDGIDGQGTSTFAIVHPIDYSWWYGLAPMVDNAYWAPWYFGMVFGEGGYPADPTWGFFKATTELDITGHELTHGVTQETAGLIYRGQSGGLNEGNSDIFGKMVQAYADGGATGATVPNFTPGDLGAWEVGRNSGAHGALRAMYKPSLDGLSVDEWYDGIDAIDVHFSSGPVNRFFYFLAMGASSNASSATYSPYLPTGMVGLGNEKAARLWYKALTEHMVPDTDFEGARAAAIQAAQELYGQPEVDAVMKAWAAVNVGSAPGQPARVRVAFPVVHPEGSFLGDHAVPPGILARTQIFPIRTAVRVDVAVTNTTDTRVDLSFDNPAMGHQAGTFGADGSWITPNFTWYMDLLPLVAKSHADPLQYAKAPMLLADLDSDRDTEQDALDLGLTAMVWHCPAAPQAHARTAGMGDDWDFVFFTEAFTNAWPAK